MRRVLVLRPKPAAGATVKRAVERGLEALAIPLFEIEPISWEAPEAGSFEGLLLTSANAVRCGGEQLKALRGLRVYAVGDATADAAREAGFDVEASGDSGVERLLGSLDPDLRLLHLCGEDRKDPGHPRQEIVPRVVYRSRPIVAPDLSLASGAVALIHSPRAGRRFAELASDRQSIAIAAISRAAAEAVAEDWAMVETADKPTDEALLALAARLCNNPPPE